MLNKILPAEVFAVIETRLDKARVYELRFARKCP